MKKFVAPAITIAHFDMTDIIATSDTLGMSGKISDSSLIQSREGFDDDDWDF